MGEGLWGWSYDHLDGIKTNPATKLKGRRVRGVGKDCFKDLGVANFFRNLLQTSALRRYSNFQYNVGEAQN
ncbi:hypothetical protein chiPu_0013223 [Chiloscyllium punctatum]|uniref:Uncharacterized protein n=1 Tax=Chiloscyllium punctatum TaxID=137246 RepID=A0A401SWG8_CHIPU|nr:hypothetical protein [Chiloscyllium punctatum]